MDVLTNGAAAPDAAPAIPAEGPLNFRQAAESFAAKREKEAKAASEETKQRAPDGKFAKAAEESTPQGEDAAPLTEATGEDTAGDPPELAPLELPRSWAKDRAEHWGKLDRATQEYLLEHDSKTSAEVRRSQNEAAENRKAAEAELRTAQEARQRYEQAAQSTLEALTRNMMGEFADIKTAEDIQKMADEDPFRAVKFQAHRDNIKQLHEQVRLAQEQRAQENRQQFDSWATDQDKLFVETAKEFADPEKATKAREDTIKYLTEVRGIPKDALPGLWNNPLFRDAKMQMIVRDASKWHFAQQRATAATAQAKAPALKPGTAPNKGDSAQADIKALENKVSQAPNQMAQIRAAAELRSARRAASK